jgi:ATP-dependent helicase HrpA
MRTERLRSGSGSQDLASCQQIRIEWQAYEDRRQRHEEMQIHDPALAQIRWMIEELRVSLFAQSLGTSMRISSKRIAKQWENVLA